MKMATNLLPCNYEDDEYIDMEVISSSTLSSPPKSREFEFQMAASILQDGGEISTSSPADELFYKGKLLPLHLPPRLQMVKALLQNATFQTTKQGLKEEQELEEEEEEEEQFITISTPMDQSCRVSTELNPDEYFFDWSTELKGFIGDQPKKYYHPWSKKLRLIKQSSITQKLRASRAYLKSLFIKSACASDGSSCPKQAVEQDSNRHFLSKYLKVTKKSTYGQIQTGKCPTLANVLKGIEEDGSDNSSSHRRSFSGAIKRKCSPSSVSMSSSTSSSSSGSASASAVSSSSSSFNYSSGLFELQLSKRNSSADSELEGSIEAAIDHCKSSQKLFSSRNSLNETVHFPHSVS